MKFQNVLFAVVLLGGVSHAKITAVSENFSSGESISNWVIVESVEETVISHDSPSIGDYDDQNPDAKLDYTIGMLLTGDQIKDDGGLAFNIGDSIENNEAIGLTIGGTMQEGETITFSGSFYNDGSSFAKARAELYNLTDNRLLASTEYLVIQSLGHVIYAPRDFDDASLGARPDYAVPSLKYTATAEDAGDVLQIRIRESGNSAVRDVYLDNFSVTTDWPDREIRIYTITPR